MPKILIGTPWNIDFISTGFCEHLRNMIVPYPTWFKVIRARNIPDARNALCLLAVENEFTHIMMIDADQRAPQDCFLKLWAVLEEHGHDKTIAAGWATIKSGNFAGQSCVFESKDGELRPLDPSGFGDSPFPAYAVGTACLLFDTQLLERLTPPWFSDLYVIREEEKFVEGEHSDIFWPVEYRFGQDVTFSLRMRGAGMTIMVEPKVKLPHEIIGTL